MIRAGRITSVVSDQAASVSVGVPFSILCTINDLDESNTGLDQPPRGQAMPGKQVVAVQLPNTRRLAL